MLRRVSLSVVNDLDASSGRKNNKLGERKPSLCLKRASRTYFTRSVVHHIVWTVHHWEKGLSINNQLHCWFLLTEERHRAFIQTSFYSQDCWFVFLPKEVIWAGVCTLNLPGHCLAINWEWSTLPEPPSKAVFSTQNLVYGALVVQLWHVNFLFNSLLDWIVNFRKCGVYVFDI